MDSGFLRLERGGPRGALSETGRNPGRKTRGTRSPGTAWRWSIRTKGGIRKPLTPFEQLLGKNPGYTAAYFHYGMTLKQLGEEEKAKEVLSKGVRVAEEKGEKRAREEMLEELNALGEFS